ncbi:hypothetical protein ACTFIW_003833 [Dictyostelium discoideum]
MQSSHSDFTLVEQTNVNSEISHWLTVLNQWNGKEISLFPSYYYVLTTDASESGAGATLKKANKIIKTWSFQWSTTQSNMSSNRRKMLAMLMAYQALCRKLNNCKLSGLTTTHSFAFYPGEDELIQFEEGFYNTDLPNLEISNLVSDDSSTSSSSSSSHVSSSTGNIPRSIDQTIGRVNTNPNSTTLETGDYSTFQSHVMSIIRIQKSSTAELLMKSWEPSTLKVYSSSYTRFRNFCTLNSLNPTNITLVVFISTLSSSGIDISKFKSHSTRSAMASLLLSNNVPFHVAKKMGRWKANDTVYTFYDKRIIGEKSGGFLNTVVQIS